MPPCSFAFTCAMLLAVSAVFAENGAPVSAVTTIPAAPVAASSPNLSLPAGATASAPTAPPKITYSQCHVDGPYIAMTFDDGPHAQHTPRLLDMLKQRDIKATFFVVGQCAQQYPDILKRIVAEGHEIANHSWSHPLLSKMGEGAVTEQLQKTHDAIVSTTGVTPKLMRPPFGGFTANQRGWANARWGYKCILWDVDPLDWKVRNAEHVKTQIIRQTVNGSIILSHDIHKTTVDAMPDTLDGLAGRGFKFVTVSELLTMDRPIAPKPKATPAPKAADATTTSISESAKPVGETTPPAKKAAVARQVK